MRKSIIFIMLAAMTSGLFAERPVFSGRDLCDAVSKVEAKFTEEALTQYVCEELGWNKFGTSLTSNDLGSECSFTAESDEYRDLEACAALLHQYLIWLKGVPFEVFVPDMFFMEESPAALACDSSVKAQSLAKAAVNQSEYIRDQILDLLKRMGPYVYEGTLSPRDVYMHTSEEKRKFHEQKMAGFVHETVSLAREVRSHLEFLKDIITLVHEVECLSEGEEIVFTADMD